jgi:polysaccharide export outer membrane protein
MRIIIYFFSFFSIALVLTSCSGKQYQIAFRTKGRRSMLIHRKDSNNDLANYHIKPQDMLQIRNLQNIKYIVDESPFGFRHGRQWRRHSPGLPGRRRRHRSAPGYWPCGRMGALPVYRQQNLLRAFTVKTCLKDPIIELKITNLKVTLLGEFKGQGSFPLVKDRTTLVEMIGQAGGLSDKANETNIKIIRGRSKNPQVTYINLRDIQSINDPRAILQNGDIVYISQNKRADTQR